MTRSADLMAFPGFQSSGYIGSYVFGFNGQEKDNEVKGRGNSYDFGARIQDPRLGRWLACDPFERKYPQLSPYNYVNNGPIRFIDPDGRDIIVAVSKATEADDPGHMVIFITNYKEVKVKVIENGVEIIKSYYQEDGYYVIDNKPKRPNGATLIQEFRGPISDLLDDNTENYGVENDQGEVHSTNKELGFDKTNVLSGDPDWTKPFVTFEVAENELAIRDEARNMVNSKKTYTHGTGGKTQNDCVSIVQKMLVLTKYLDPNFELGRTTAQWNNHNLVYNTPNQAGLELRSMFPHWVGSNAWSDYGNMSTENAQAFLISCAKTLAQHKFIIPKAESNYNEATQK